MWPQPEGGLESAISIEGPKYVDFRLLIKTTLPILSYHVCRRRYEAKPSHSESFFFSNHRHCSAVQEVMIADLKRTRNRKGKDHRCQWRCPARNHRRSFRAVRRQDLSSKAENGIQGNMGRIARSSTRSRQHEYKDPRGSKRMNLRLHSK